MDDKSLIQIETEGKSAIQLPYFESPQDMLDKELYQTVDDALLTQGSRSVIGFEKEHSLENAFFITPETKENLSEVFYVHASVNLLNSFLPEIANAELGTSKERVNLIENVLQKMLEFLDEEVDIAEQPLTE